jgi:hypothetical protein
MLLLPWLLAGSADFTTAESRSSSLALTRLLHNDRFVDEGWMRLTTEYFLRKLDRSNLLPFQIDDINRRHGLSLLRLAHDDEPIGRSRNRASDEEKVLFGSRLNHFQTLGRHPLGTHVPRQRFPFPHP